MAVFIAVAVGVFVAVAVGEGMSVGNGVGDGEDNRGVRGAVVASSSPPDSQAVKPSTRRPAARNANIPKRVSSDRKAESTV